MCVKEREITFASKTVMLVLPKDYHYVSCCCCRYCHVNDLISLGNTSIRANVRSFGIISDFVKMLVFVRGGHLVKNHFYKKAGEITSSKFY
jgi:hypothetical protein